MSILDHIDLEATPDGVAIRTYVEAMHKDKELFATCFDDDIVFNGLLFKAKGHEAVIAGFHDFVTNMMVSMRIEAITRAGDSDKFMVLFFAMLKGTDKELPIVDLVTVKNGKIVRVDNCFDTSKVPKEMNMSLQETSSM